DEENAFKPIDFNAPTNVPVTSDDNLPVATSDELPVPVEPSANFVPPVSFEPVATDVVPATESAPVLDSITSVSAPVEQIDSELLAGFDNPGVTPVPAAPVVPQYANDAPVAEVQPEQPMPEVTPAPDYAPVRPVSPVTGVAAPVVPSDVPQRKPTTMYYLLLVILIVLSVFTLWMYQGSTTDNLPELGASSQPTVADEEKSQESLMDGTAFIDVDQTETVKEQVKVAEPVAKPVVPPTPVAEPEVVAPTPVVESVIVPDVVPDVVTVTESPVVVPDVESQAVQVTPQVVEDTVVEDGTPFLTQETVQPAKTKPIAEIIASKPVYNVSQQEKMFVADSEYETDEVPDVADVVVNTVESDVSSMPTVEYSQPTVVSKPVMPSQPVVTEPVMEYQEPMAVTQQEYFEEEVVEACADGSAPDKNGCCPGENYVNVVGAGYACCVESTGECFPPMK
ncbi:MAG: hypothetical protein J6K82_03650, partial [Alphaproteobacteria bacterium]|nr:hypothetical protein [Alphaproteobacteria bacterium]